MYGRDPESFEAVGQVFHQLLKRFPADQALKAFEIWMCRNQEFPTPADIVSLIKRKGKPPFAKEVYNSIGRKAPEDRSSEDWQYLREYEEEQQNSEWGTDFPDEFKDRQKDQQILELKQQIAELKQENARAWEAARNQRNELPIDDKIAKTVAFMKSTGASQADIDEFMYQQRVGIESCIPK